MGEGMEAMAQEGVLLNLKGSSSPEPAFGLDVT